MFNGRESLSAFRYGRQLCHRGHQRLLPGVTIGQCPTAGGHGGGFGLDADRQCSRPGSVVGAGDSSVGDLSGTLVFIKGTSFLAATNGQGYFTMAQVPVGTGYRVMFTRPGYEPMILEPIPNNSQIICYGS